MVCWVGGVGRGEGVGGANDKCLADVSLLVLSLNRWQDFINISCLYFMTYECFMCLLIYFTHCVVCSQQEEENARLSAVRRRLQRETEELTDQNEALQRELQNARKG